MSKVVHIFPIRFLVGFSFIFNLWHKNASFLSAFNELSNKYKNDNNFQWNRSLTQNRFRNHSSVVMTHFCRFLYWKRALLLKSFRSQIQDVIWHHTWGVQKTLAKNWLKQSTLMSKWLTCMKKKKVNCN